MGAGPAGGSSISIILGQPISAPADGQHLLLAAGEVPPRCLRRSLSRGNSVDPLEIGGVLFGPDEKGAHLEVFLHRQHREDLAPLRHVGDALGHHLVSGEPGDRPPLVPIPICLCTWFAGED